MITLFPCEQFFNFVSFLLYLMVVKRLKCAVLGVFTVHVNCIKSNGQGCGNTMPDLSDLVPFHSGQVDNFNLLVLGQVQNLYKVNKILYLIF